MHAARALTTSKALTAAAVTLALGTAACSVGGTTEQSAGSGSKTVVVATHDSWAMSKKVLGEFTDRTGYQVRIEPNGDAGQLTNKLVLTKGSPIADMTYGIDNTFASRAVDEGVLTDYTPKDLPASASSYALDGPAEARELTPVDYSDVCVNVDDTWFARHEVTPPRTLDDLTDPDYKSLFVTPGASSSSPGLAFLLATIAKYGDGWQDYWTKLMANGAKVTSGWSDAYEVDFTAGGGKGDVYPVDRAVALPADWAKYAKTAPKPFTVPPAEVAEKRSTWLSQWSDITTR